MVRARRSAGPTTCLSCSRSTSVRPIVASMTGMRFVKVRLRIAPHGRIATVFGRKVTQRLGPALCVAIGATAGKWRARAFAPLRVASAERQENCAGSPLLPADAYG